MFRKLRKFFNTLRKLCPVEPGPWWGCRHYVYNRMKEIGVKPGDIICRRGNAFVYGFFPFSDFICYLTGSNYSHAALVLEVGDDILLADVDTIGLHRQFIMDWCDAVRGDDIIILRYTENEFVPKLAVEIAKSVFAIDPKEHGEEFLDSNDGRCFYCVMLVCWCYLRAGALLCEEVAIGKLPNWRRWLNPFAKLHSVDPEMMVWCVGNEKIGLLSSPSLKEVGRIAFLPHKNNSKSYIFSGA